MSGFDDAVDVLIVGSGPVGCAFARAIADLAPGLDVLVVEAGPAATVPPGLHMANIADRHERVRAQAAFQGPFPEPYPRPSHEEVDRGGRRAAFQALLRRPGLFAIGSGDPEGDGFPVAQASAGVGGMGSHWFGACPRPDGAERIDFVDRDRLDAAYDRAEQLLRVGNDRLVTNPALAQRLRDVIGGVVDEGRPDHRRVQQMPMAVVRTGDGVIRTGPDVILGDLLQPSTHFRLAPETAAVRILMDGDHAVGVRLLDRGSGVEREVGAGAVVVAGDSIRTPQLLFASGIRPAALGRHLNEHPQVSVTAVMTGPSGPGGEREQGDTGVMSDSSAMTIAASGVTWIPYEDETFPYHGQLSNVDPTTLGLPPEEAAGLGPVVGMSLFCAQDVDPDNRVEFSESETDWLGLPLPSFHYRWSAGDRERIERAAHQLMDISAALGATLNGEEPRVLPSGASLHYMGTVRMGVADDGTSVCDPHSRVWGTQNVYVGGNGVIPTSTACNPTLTSVALAVMSAEEIVRQAEDAAS